MNTAVIKPPKLKISYPCIAIDYEEDHKCPCAYCNRSGENNFIIQDAAGVIFKVGPECVKKVLGNKDLMGNWSRNGFHQTRWALITPDSGKKYLVRIVVTLNEEDEVLAMFAKGRGRDDLLTKWKKYQTVKTAKPDILRKFESWCKDRGHNWEYL